MNPELTRNVRAFLTFAQARRMVPTAAAIPRAPTAVGQSDLTVFLRILAHSSHRLLMKA
jgi:hypothetical protein